MQDFIVLGIIPGTHYQTTFLFWVYVTLSLVCSLLLVRLARKRHAFYAYLIARKIARLIDQYQLQA